MTDERYELSRRKILAGIGAMGVASAGAGLGTSAYFSDEETFSNNSLTAGALDLKVDWEEHYSDWSDDENAISDGDGDFEVSMDPPEDAENYRAFPPGTESEFNGSDPLLWIPDEFVGDFMANTALEAFPDEDNDGSAEFPIEDFDGDACDFLADVGGEIDDIGTYVTNDDRTLGRTDNDDTRREDDTPAPLVNLQDVKPGDFGEITFSTHLCDNPGYLWMNMPDGLETSENGINEPESEADGEDEDEPRPATEETRSRPPFGTITPVTTSMIARSRLMLWRWPTRLEASMVFWEVRVRRTIKMR